VNEGVELGLLGLEAMAADGAAPTPEHVALCLDLISAFPEPPGASSGAAGGGGGAMDEGEAEQQAQRAEELARLAAAAAKWAGRVGGGPAARQIHDAFAAYLWRSHGWRQLARASAHWARGGDAPAFASAVAQCARAGAPGERELFAARALLTALAAGAPADAPAQLAHGRAVLEALIAAGVAPAGAPLLGFGELLLQALGARSRKAVALLARRFGPLLSRDPALPALLERAETLHLGARPQMGLPGLLGSLLGGM